MLASVPFLVETVCGFTGATMDHSITYFKFFKLWRLGRVVRRRGRIAQRIENVADRFLRPLRRQRADGGVAVAFADSEIGLDRGLADRRRVFAGGDDVALAGHDVADREDRGEAVEAADVPVLEVEELAVHADARDRFRNRTDRADDRRTTDLVGLVLLHHATVLDLRAAEDDAGEATVFDDQAVGCGERLDVEEVLARTLTDHADATLLDLLQACFVRPRRCTHHRHVLDTPAVVDGRRRDAELVPFEAVLLEDLRDALDLELLHVGLDPALAENLDRPLERVDLRDVDRGESTAQDDRAVVEFVGRFGHVALFVMVERDHEGILIDEAVADVFFRPVDGNGSVPPRAVREHDRGESPILDEFLEVDVLADLRARHEGDAFLLELLVDDAVLLVAQRDVPPGKTVLDLSVRPRVLLEHEDVDALVCESAGDLGSCRCAPDHCYEMSASIVCHGADVRTFRPPDNPAWLRARTR